MTSEHEPVPFCDSSGQDACVACSEAADRCVPWPCEFVEQPLPGRWSAGEDDDGLWLKREAL